jgi:hypothetical protein
MVKVMECFIMRFSPASYFSASDTEENKENCQCKRNLPLFGTVACPVIGLMRQKTYLATDSIW